MKIILLLLLFVKIASFSQKDYYCDSIIFPNIISENSYFNFQDSKTCSLFVSKFELVKDKTILSINFSDIQYYYTGLNEIVNRIIQLDLPSELYDCEITVINDLGIKKLYMFRVLILE